MNILDNVIQAIREYDSKSTLQRYCDIVIKVQDSMPVMVEVTNKMKPTRKQSVLDQLRTVEQVNQSLGGEDKRHR